MNVFYSCPQHHSNNRKRSGAISSVNRRKIHGKDVKTHRKLKSIFAFSASFKYSCSLLQARLLFLLLGIELCTHTYTILRGESFPLQDRQCCQEPLLRALQKANKGGRGFASPKVCRRWLGHCQATTPRKTITRGAKGHDRQWSEQEDEVILTNHNMRTIFFVTEDQSM